jgi:hypothetical protein
MIVYLDHKCDWMAVILNIYTSKFILMDCIRILKNKTVFFSSGKYDGQFILANCVLTRHDSSVRINFFLYIFTYYNTSRPSCTLKKLKLLIAI